jgi:hypothetical protein
VEHNPAGDSTFTCMSIIVCGGGRGCTLYTSTLLSDHISQKMLNCQNINKSFMV